MVELNAESVRGMPDKVVDLRMRHHPSVEGAVEDSDRPWPREASEKLADGVRWRGDGHRGWSIQRDPVKNEVDRISPRPGGSTKARRIGGDLHMETRAWRLEAPEQRQRGNAGEPTAHHRRLPGWRGHPPAHVDAAAGPKDSAVGERPPQGPTTHAIQELLPRVETTWVQGNHLSTVAGRPPGRR